MAWVRHTIGIILASAVAPSVWLCILLGVRWFSIHAKYVHVMQTGFIEDWLWTFFTTGCFQSMNACYMWNVRDYRFLGQVLTLTQQPHAPVHLIYIGELRNYTHSSCLQLPVQPHTSDLSGSMQFGSWRGTSESVSAYSASYCAKSKGHFPVSASEGGRGTCVGIAAQAAELRQ